MGRTKGTKNGTTRARIKSLNIKVNSDGITYDKTRKRVMSYVDKNLRIHITLKKAGDERTMFFAAAGVRNYMRRHGSKPSKDQIDDIIKTASNAVANNMVTVNVKTKSDPKTSKVVETSASIKRDRGLKAFDKVITSSLDKGIINKHSAASKIFKGKNTSIELFKSLGLDIDHRYISYLKTLKGDEYLDVKITTKHGPQREKIYLHDFSNKKEMIAAADKVRRHILITGKAPTINKKSLLYAEAVSKTDKILNSSSSEMLRTTLKKRPSPSVRVESVAPVSDHHMVIPQPIEITAPTQSYVQEVATHEQQPKLRVSNLFSRIKGWLLS